MSDHDHSWRPIPETVLIECDYCHDVSTLNAWNTGLEGGQFWPDSAADFQKITFTPGLDLDYETYRVGLQVEFGGEDV